MKFELLHVSRGDVIVDFGVADGMSISTAADPSNPELSKMPVDGLLTWRFAAI